MGDVAVEAGQAADFLDELLTSIESLSGRLDALEASGELTPELEARIVAQVDRTRLAVSFLGEMIDPTGAPLLKIKRQGKRKAGEMLASGLSEGEVRSAFAELAGRTAWALPEGQQPLLGPLMETAVDEVMAEVPAVGPG